jgi:hypothetical protein
MGMGRHHNQAGVSVASRLHDLVGRIAAEQFTRDHYAIEFRRHWPIQILLSALDGLRVQVPRRDLISPLERAGEVAERRHYVQQDDVGAKAVRPPGSLTHYLPGSLRQNNRNQNSLNAQHG